MHLKVGTPTIHDKKRLLNLRKPVVFGLVFVMLAGSSFLFFFSRRPQSTNKVASSTLVARDTSGVYQAKNGETEVVDKRTETSKTFAQPDGKTFRVAGQVGPIQYKVNSSDPGESFKEINLTILPSKDSTSDYAMEQNGYQVYFQNKGYEALFKREGHFLKIKPLALVWQNDQKEEQLISNAIQINQYPEINNETYTLTYKNIFGPGIDFRYNISPDHFFKTVIINDPNSLPKPTIDQEGLKLSVILGASWDSETVLGNSFAEGITTELPNSYDPNVLFNQTLENPNSYNHRDKIGNDLFWMNQPKAWDSASERQETNLDWSLNLKGSNVFMNLSVPYSAFSSKMTFPLYVDAAITEHQTAASADDARGYGITWPGYDTRTIDNLYYTTGVDVQYFRSFGARFLTIPIPQGATINTANLSVRNALATNYPTDLTIFGEDVDSSAAYNITDHSPGDAIRTTASVRWNIGTVLWTIDSWHDTPDISSVIGEITGRAGWVSNNNLSVLILNTSHSLSATTNYKTWWGWDQTGNLSGPKFNVTYTDMSTSPPIVSVAAAITQQTAATLNGNITDVGGENATERGFNLYNGSVCAGDVIANPKDTGGSYIAGAYSKGVADLTVETAYSYKAYAINSFGTGTSGCQSFVTTAPWYNSGWPYRKAITLDNSANADTLTDHFVKISLNGANFDFAKIQADGDDFIFTDSNGTTLLNYWIENVGATSATLWVKVPSIAGSGMKTIYLYYGNQTTSSGASKPAVNYRFATASEFHYDMNNGNATDQANAAMEMGWLNGETTARGLDYIFFNGDNIRYDTAKLSIVKAYYDTLTAPYRTTVGNHDTLTDAAWTTLFGYSPNNDFSVGNYAFIMARSTNTLEALVCPDNAWLDARLTAYDSKAFTFVFFHATPKLWAASSDDCPATMTTIGNHPNVIAVYNGHDHFEDNWKFDAATTMNYLFDGHIGDLPLGVPYLGYRVTEVMGTSQVYTYQWDPTAETILNSNFLYRTASIPTTTLMNEEQNVVPSAIVPLPPTVNTVSATSLITIINQNGNPDTTQYAISCDADTTFLNFTTNACEAIADSTDFWRTYADWGGAGGFVVTGLIANTQHTYKVKARNTLKVETALSSGTLNFNLANPSSSAIPSASPSIQPIPTTAEIIQTVRYYATTPFVSFPVPAGSSSDSAITFDASESFSTSGIASFLWDFGDGTTSGEMKVDHQYQSPGRYTVTLTIVDKAGKTATKTQTVDVKPPKPTVEDIKMDGDSLVFTGKAYKNTIVHLTIHSNPIFDQTDVNDEGSWTCQVANAKEVLGAGDHTISVTDSYILADKSELTSESSKAYDFQLSLDGDKLKLANKKTKIWQYISLGLFLVMIVGFIILLRRRKKLISGY